VTKYREFLEKLETIQRLLEEAYNHAFEAGAYGKSMDGSIKLEIPPYFWQRSELIFDTEVCIYSYVLGPYRNHRFSNINDALESVQEWHKLEMCSAEEEDKLFPVTIAKVID